MPQNHAQDPEVARLQVQVEGINTSLSALRDSQTAQFNALAQRLDGFSTIVSKLATVQADQQAHSNGLARAFDEIKEHKQSCADIDRAHDEWHVAHDNDHKDLNRKLNRSLGWVGGVGAVLGVMIAMGVWVGDRVVDQLDRTTEKANQNAIDLLEHKLDEATKRGAP